MRRILILKPCCLGDVLLATPIAASLRAAFPESRIDWAVDGHSRAALEGNPHLDSLIEASHCIRGDFRPGSWLRLLRRIRRGRYDALFTPDRSPLLSLAAAASGIERRVGLASGWRGFGHRLRVPPRESAHEAEIYLDLIRQSRIEPAPPHPIYRPSAADREHVAALLAGEVGLEPVAGDAELRRDASAGSDSAPPLLAVHPGGGENPGMTLLSKRWPPKRFAALAERAVQTWGARPLLLGGPGDREPTRALLAALPDDVLAIDLCGRLSLGQTAAMIERARVYVGNDSGIAHLAAGVGRPVLTIFGPTRPERYGPPAGLGIGLAPDDAQPSTSAAEDLRGMQGSRAIEGVTVDRAWSKLQDLWSGGD